MNKQKSTEQTKKQQKTWIKIIKIIGIVLICLILFALIAFGVLRALGKSGIRKNISGEAPVLESTESTEEGWQDGWIRYNGQIYAYNEDIMTFLVMGVDNDDVVKKAKDGLSGGQADAMFLAVMNPHDKSVSIIAVNRNAMALVDVYDEDGVYMGQYTKQITLQHGYGDGMQLKDCLKKIPLLFHYIDSHSKEAYGTAIGYLTQEGLLEPVSYALVDSGWIGTIQQSIEHLLRQKQPDRKLEGYYFGLYEIPEGEGREKYHSFYFTPWGEIKRKVHFSNSLFEAVFSAPEGMTLSYRTEGGKDKIIYVPVTDSRENLNRERISRYICWLEEFLQEKKQSLPQADSGYVEELLSPFMGNPTQFEAEAYGSLLFSDDVREDDNQKVSADFSEQEIKNHHLLNRLLIMTGVRKKVLHESAWIEGSIATCGTLNERGRVRNRLHAVFYKYIIYIRKWLKQRNR